MGSGCGGGTSRREKPFRLSRVGSNPGLQCCFSATLFYLGVRLFQITVSLNGVMFLQFPAIF